VTLIPVHLVDVKEMVHHQRHRLLSLATSWEDRIGQVALHESVDGAVEVAEEQKVWLRPFSDAPKVPIRPGA